MGSVHLGQYELSIDQPKHSPLSCFIDWSEGQVQVFDMRACQSQGREAVALKRVPSEPGDPTFGTATCQFWGLKGHTDGLPKLGSPTKPFGNSMSEYIPSPAGRPS